MLLFGCLCSHKCGLFSNQIRYKLQFFLILCYIGDVVPPQNHRTVASRPLFKVKSDSSLPASPSSYQRHPKLRHRVTINGIPPHHVTSSNPSSARRSLSSASLIPGINFTKILRAVFSNESVLHSFSVLVFVIICRKEIVKKFAFKMLVKLLTGCRIFSTISSMGVSLSKAMNVFLLLIQCRCIFFRGPFSESTVIFLLMRNLISAIAPLADIAEHSADIDLNRIRINNGGESATDQQRRRFEHPPMLVINDGGGRKSLSMTKISEKPIFLSEQHSNIRRNASWTTMTTALNS